MRNENGGSKLINVNSRDYNNLLRFMMMADITYKRIVNTLCTRVFCNFDNATLHSHSVPFSSLLLLSLPYLDLFIFD